MRNVDSHPVRPCSECPSFQAQSGRVWLELRGELTSYRLSSIYFQIGGRMSNEAQLQVQEGQLSGPRKTVCSGALTKLVWKGGNENGRSMGSIGNKCKQELYLY